MLKGYTSIFTLYTPELNYDNFKKLIIEKLNHNYDPRDTFAGFERGNI